MFIIVRKRKLFLFLIFLISFAFISLFLANTYHTHFLLKTTGTDTAVTKDEYLIVIYVEEKRLYLFKNEKLFKQYKVATGKPGWPSPLGEWEITEKSKWGEGFGGYWLGLNVPWGIYGIHGTLNENSIGRPASHGCIRMAKNDIKELFKTVPVKTPVIIKYESFGPFGEGFRPLKPGDRGADVLAVQRELKTRGYYKGKEDGVFGEDLKKSLHRFQKDKKLNIKNTITSQDYKAMGFSRFE